MFFYEEEFLKKEEGTTRKHAFAHKYKFKKPFSYHVDLSNPEPLM